MSQKEIAEETRRKLDELEQEIRAAKAAPGAPEQIAGETEKEWQAMLDTHAAIRRKLDADQSAATLEGIRLDVDVLRNSFARWMGRVESNFAKSGGGS